MFEHKTQKVISRKSFYTRQIRFTWYSLIVVFISMVLGVAGYMITANLAFTDAVLNASMILTGMGPVNPMPNDVAKWFASLYALYSGVAFLTTIGLFIAPIVHRFMHKYHLDQ
ncbi:MAG: hypothetical protein ACKO6L_08360 [Flavobacteriales bacterium]